MIRVMAGFGLQVARLIDVIRIGWASSCSTDGTSLARAFTVGSDFIRWFVCFAGPLVRNITA
jgi:hypothetical protein